MRSNSVTRQVSFNRTNIGGKCQNAKNSNVTYWVIFKQCDCGKVQYLVKQVLKKPVLVRLFTFFYEFQLFVYIFQRISAVCLLYHFKSQLFISYSIGFSAVCLDFVRIAFGFDDTQHTFRYHATFLNSEPSKFLA